MAGVPGGWSDTKDATAEIQKMCDQVFKAVQYREQVVAGMNYIIKIDVGGNKYHHVFVFKDLPEKGGQARQCCRQEHKTKDDPIDIFEC